MSMLPLLRGSQSFGRSGTALEPYESALGPHYPLVSGQRGLAATTSVGGRRGS